MESLVSRFLGHELDSSNVGIARIVAIRMRLSCFAFGLGSAMALAVGTSRALAQAAAPTVPSGSASSQEAPVPPPPPLPPPGVSAPKPTPTPRSTAATKPYTVTRASSTSQAQRTGEPIVNPIINATRPVAKIDTNRLDPNALAFDARQKEVNVKPGESEARFTFAFTNVSKSEVTLQRVQTSCGCTAARLPMEPWVIPAGGRGDISVVMDVRGKFGTVTKTATVYSSAGQFALLVKSIIPQQTAADLARPMGDRSRNLQIAAADRQAALRGECASCHATPAVGKTGKALFDAACGICHTAEHRASFVPDLARLNKPTDLNYWITWVSYGREGSLMPAFLQSKGGFLTEAQIQSLATYMETEFKLESALSPGAARPVAQPPAPLAPAPAAK